MIGVIKDNFSDEQKQELFSCIGVEFGILLLFGVGDIVMVNKVFDWVCQYLVKELGMVKVD